GPACLLRRAGRLRAVPEPPSRRRLLPYAPQDPPRPGHSPAPHGAVAGEGGGAVGARARFCRCRPPPVAALPPRLRQQRGGPPPLATGQARPRRPPRGAASGRRPRTVLRGGAAR